MEKEVTGIAVLWILIRGGIGFAFSLYLMFVAYQFLEGQKALVIKDGQTYIKELVQ